jgi:hypothetical protein
MKHLPGVLLVWLSMSLCGFVPSVVRAQIVETGTITGVVRDNSGAVIAGAQVKIKNNATGIVNSTVTDSQGIYVSPPTDPGDYTVELALRSTIPRPESSIPTMRLRR